MDRIQLYVTSTAPNTYPSFRISNCLIVPCTWAHTQANTYTVTGPAIGDGWYHIAGSLVGAGGDAHAATRHLDIYVNGIWSASSTVPGPFSQGYQYSVDIGNHGVWVGRSLGGAILSTDRFDGTIDEVRFWTEARTQAQIQEWMFKEIKTPQDWQSANPNEALVGYWKFNEGTGATLLDSSGESNLGTKYYCNIIQKVTSTPPVVTCNDCATECYAFTQGLISCTATDCPDRSWTAGWISGYPF